MTYREESTVASTNMDALAWLRKHPDGDGDDLLREMVAEFAARLMAAEVDVLCGAGCRDACAARASSRNGYRDRRFDTRVGTIDLALSKLRGGSYFSDWLIEPRRRAEKALVSVVADCYLRGVSTRRVDKLVKTLGIEGLSKSQVSRMAAELDEVVAYSTRIVVMRDREMVAELNGENINPGVIVQAIANHRDEELA